MPATPPDDSATNFRRNRRFFRLVKGDPALGISFCTIMIPKYTMLFPRLFLFSSFLLRFVLVYKAVCSFVIMELGGSGCVGRRWKRIYWGVCFLVGDVIIVANWILLLDYL